VLGGLINGSEWKGVWELGKMREGNDVGNCVLTTSSVRRMNKLRERNGVENCVLTGDCVRGIG